MKPEIAPSHQIFVCAPVCLFMCLCLCLSLCLFECLLLQPQPGDGRSSAFVNFEAFAGASSALAELSQGLFVGKIKLKGDAGRNASFVLDLLIELEILSTQSTHLSHLA